MSISDADAEAKLARVRAFIASEVVQAETATHSVGEITLYPHQRQAVARLRDLLQIAGGAMLADVTGLGKTYVALAVAGDFERTLIIAPASLEDSWRRAAARAHTDVEFISLERLSRGAYSPLELSELIIVDEAHHLRNPHTKRYIAAAALCDRARVLLLSATPLQNRRDDLVAQLALFLGDAAQTSSDAELARLIVRRRAGAVGSRIPEMDGPRWIHLPVEDDLLDDLLALPPPVSASDEGAAGALVVYALLRQWASSRAALVGALRRRVAKAVALISSLEAGRWPNRAQLAAWTQAEETMQLALPELLTPLGASSTEVSRLLEAVRNHADALRALLARLHHMPDPDPARAASLTEVCRSHPDARVLAFSSFAETVHALSRVLIRNQDGVAMLTARGGRVAGGRVSRREILAQFGPHNGIESAAERISLLLSTDVLSEGLDLQRASVVVHLDLPWNPARLAQRVGRVRRLGSQYEAVYVYALAPPASSERVLQVTSRLRAKLGAAREIVGVESAVIPDMAVIQPIGQPELTSETLTLLERWRPTSAACSAPDQLDGTTPHIAAAFAPTDGILALIAIGRERVLVAALDDSAASVEPALVKRAVEWSLGRGCVPTRREIARATDAIHTWSRNWSSRRRLSLVSASGARARVRVAAKLTGVLSTIGRHERANLAPLVSRAQRALRSPLGAAAERTLIGLASAPATSSQWLRGVAALAASRDERQPLPTDPELLAVIVLRRDSESSLGA